MPLVVTVAVLIVVAPLTVSVARLLTVSVASLPKTAAPVIDRFFVPPASVPLNVAVEAVSVESLSERYRAGVRLRAGSAFETEPAFRAIAAAVTSRLDSGVEWPI